MFSWLPEAGFYYKSASFMPFFVKKDKAFPQRRNFFAFNRKNFCAKPSDAVYIDRHGLIAKFSD